MMGGGGGVSGDDLVWWGEGLLKIYFESHKDSFGRHFEADTIFNQDIASQLAIYYLI